LQIAVALVENKEARFAMKKVLTVDDSLTIRSVIKKTLEAAGFEVHQAMNGLEALEIAAQHELALIISDYNMPEMNGLEFLTEIKNNAAYKKNRFIPFIMLTAVMGEELKAKALAAGARAYLVKPFQPQQLLEIVQKMVV
jgi:two-component system, chemotaxis family, chemotaxis protein CheY